MFTLIDQIFAPKAHKIHCVQSFINGSTALFWALAALFSFIIIYTVGRTPWTGDHPIAKSLPTHRRAQTE
jgi:hypothetical protein